MKAESRLPHIFGLRTLGVCFGGWGLTLKVLAWLGLFNYKVQWLKLEEMSGCNKLQKTC